jgi:hypothetical protein
MGYTGANPTGTGDMWIGPDGLVYNTSSLGQEAPGTPSSGSYNTYAANNPAPGTAGPSTSTLNSLAQPAYAPAPTLAPQTQLGTSNVDPQLLAALSPQSAEALTYQGFAPQAKSAESNLNQTLADAGIVGGGAVSAQDQLQGQLAASLAPSLAGEVQNSQGNLLSAASGGSGLAQQTGLTNAGAINSTNTGNTNIYNTDQQNLMNMLSQLYSQTSGQNANAISEGQAGTNSIAQQGANAYQIPSSGTGASSLASGIAGYNPTTSPSTSPQYSNYLEGTGTVGGNQAEASYG